MKVFFQGDIIKIEVFSNVFLIISKNAFIRERKMFHVSPIVNTDLINPMNISIEGKNGTKGTVICEELKLIDPMARACNKVDRINYCDIINISDAIQGMFDYD